MATRPIFVSEKGKKNYIKEILIDFQWYPGMAIVQKQKSIKSLHDSAKIEGYYPILEISSKSQVALGVRLSAFNLKLKLSNGTVTTVESAYQGSKVFTNGGPYTDLYSKTSKEAKRDKRLLNSGKLIAFHFEGENWELFPKTAFYDWLYIRALKQNYDLAEKLIHYKGFSDIEFNPRKQINCQARSAAYFVSLEKERLLEEFLYNKENFLKLYNDNNAENLQYEFNY